MIATDNEMKEERENCLRALLDSGHNKKLIVAGPGTGKTYTFKELLKTVQGPTLALTFLNNLVTDLAKELDASTEVYSFHSFARRLLHQTDHQGVSRGVDYYPPLADIQVSDIALGGLTPEPEQLAKAFLDLEEHSPLIAGALLSGNYYDAVGYNDAVYRVFLSLRDDPSIAPAYKQVVVDEYQDFSRLEAGFISCLAERSPVLIVGDDDQALYAFRHASADFIRELAEDEDYERFELPFCSRCTEVVVQATHMVVAEAQAVGLLGGRIEKRYECFLPAKRDASTRYPRIVHAQCTVHTNKAPYMARFIEARLRELSMADIQESRESGFPTVLVIGPKQFTSMIFDYLEGRFPGVARRQSAQVQVDRLDGYRRLVADEGSRLGWRILLDYFEPQGWDIAVREALDHNLEIVDLLEPAFRDHHLEVARTLAAFRAGDDLSDPEASLLTTTTGRSLDSITEWYEPSDDEDPWTDLDVDQPTILFTSLMGSKGLQANHVFIVGANQGHFPRSNTNPTEAEVCQFLVALTRTRKSCTILSCGRFGMESNLEPAQFIAWIDALVEKVAVNKDYFE